MAASYDDVKRWVKQGLNEGATHIVSVCDTYDYDDYPVYVMPGEDPEMVARAYRGKDMQRVNEIICLGETIGVNGKIIMEAKAELHYQEKEIAKKGETMEYPNANALKAKAMINRENACKEQANKIYAKLNAIAESGRTSLVLMGKDATEISDRDLVSEFFKKRGFKWIETYEDQRDEVLVIKIEFGD